MMRSHKALVVGVLFMVVGILSVTAPYSFGQSGIGTVNPAQLGEKVFVRDATGKLVGETKGFVHDDTQIVLKVTVTNSDGSQSQDLYPLSVNRNSFWGTSGDLGYTTGDCSGTPYIVLGNVSADYDPTYALLPRTSVSLPGHTLYRQDPDPYTVTILSYRLQFGYAEAGIPPGGCFSEDTAPPGYFYPCNDCLAFIAEALLDLDTVFTLPFKIVIENVPAGGGGDHTHIYLKPRNLKDKDAVEALTGPPIPTP